MYVIARLQLLGFDKKKKLDLPPYLLTIGSAGQLN